MKLQNTLSKRSLHIVHSKTMSMDIIKYICLVIICRLLLDAVYSSSISRPKGDCPWRADAAA